MLTMSLQRPIVVLLYWGGKIILSGESIAYDPPICQKVLILKERIGYDELVNRIYNAMKLDRDKFRVHLTFRNRVEYGNGFAILFGMPLMNDKGVDVFYYLKSSTPEYAAEIYIDVEDQQHVDQTNIQLALNTYAQLNSSNIASQLVQPFVGGTGGKYAAQFAPSISAAPLASNVNRNRSSGRYNESHTIQRQLSWLTKLAENQHSELPTFSAPSTGYAGDGQANDHIACDEGSPWPSNVTPSLWDDASVSATLPFDGGNGGHAEHLNVWNEHTMDLRLGMLFDSKKHVSRAVKLWSIKQNREYEVCESKQNTWFVKCKNRSSHPPCNWQLRATLWHTQMMWMIVSFVKSHTCVRVSNSIDHMQLSSNIVVEYIMHHLKSCPIYRIKEIQAAIKEMFHIDISYRKAWYARRRAIDLVYGDWPTSVSQLPKYMKELVATNPGTAVVWMHHPHSHDGNFIFDYVFWAFAPAIQAFPHLKPVVCVDGTFMKGPYKAKLLTAVGIDANNHHLPLAFALVDEESNRSWKWFMRQLRVHVCHDIQGICVISNCHKGIINAMKTLDDWREPVAMHRFCLDHVLSEFTQKFKNRRLKNLCWLAGDARQEYKFDKFMNQIWELNPKAHEWLMKKAVEPSQWALSKDGGYRWGITSTNMAEYFNNAFRDARYLPIKACVEFTFNQTMELFLESRKLLSDCRYPLPKYSWDKYVANHHKARGHEVQIFHEANGFYRVVTARRPDKRGGNPHYVNFRLGTCSCQKWKELRFPCSHVIATYYSLGMNPTKLIGEVHTLDAYVQTYSGKFQPLRHPRYWADVDCNFTILSTRLAKK
ncbi:uncharacterized protein [Coffea arabica]|uniref:Uncharacterized protein isoform X2 n=1 Tax=Coffea arabica TaxID=13443 RepID=A0A6P6VYV9_COFAR|nr:uncharacterized protein LOC113727559 isoform X2 [Coffea arabica]